MFKKKVKIDTPEGPKMANMVEGSGVFVCEIHEFSTEDINKFNLHMKEPGHYLAAGSVSSCVMCNKPNVSMEGLQPGQNAVCDECQIKLADQAVEAKKRLAKQKPGAR